MNRLHPKLSQGLTRRDLLGTGLAAGATFSAGSLLAPGRLWAQPKRGGILRVRGYDPPHFDPHLTLNFKTNTTLSFVYSKLVRHKVGAGVSPGTFAVEPDLAERWEEPDDTTVVFHLRRWRSLAEQASPQRARIHGRRRGVTYSRYLSEKGNPNRYTLEPVDRVEVVDRHTVRFRLKEPFVWLLHMLANPLGTWIVARGLVEKYGDLKKAETAIGTGPFVLERYDPNVKAVFRRNPDYFRPGLPGIDGVDWLVMEDAAAGLAAYRTGQIDAANWHWWAVREQDLAALKKSSSASGLPGLSVQRDARDLHADGQASFQRRPGAPRDLPCRRPAGRHRGRVPQGSADPGDLAGTARVVAAHRPARSWGRLLPA